MASNEQREAPLLNSYQNWEDQYNNNGSKRVFKCRCQGSEGDNHADAHHYILNNSLGEKIESLDRKKEIVSKQYSDYLRNQELERLKKLKQYQQENKILQIALVKQNDLPVLLPSQANLYNEFERRMLNFRALNQEQVKSNRDQPNHSAQANLVGGIRRDPDKFQNKDYEDYIEKHREYSDYNLQLSKNKKQSNERQFEIDKLHEGNVIIKKNFFNEYDQNMKSFETDKKQQYKQSLDEQRMFQVRSKLAKERYTIGSAMRNPQYFYYNSPDYINQSFLNNNQFVEVNPFNCKKYDLGNTCLQRNVLLDPQFDYKYNRYMFPKSLQ